ncbi:MAG TPA: ATP-binding protein [Polyangiaceae bacterium]|nr:ATP-binding protein [Polyangiaceae bacterium]
MKGWSIRWLLLGVSAAVFVLPALLVVLLRSYTGYLVRRTEEQLLGQGILIAEAFRDEVRRDAGREPAREPHGPAGEVRYAPLPLLAEHLREQSPSEPRVLPLAPAAFRDTSAYRAGHRLEPLLRRAQVYNLSAVRLLDGQGCVVATTRGDDEHCLSELPEVRGALAGHYTAVLRPRISDEPPPPLGSLSRRGDQRLFLALPVLEGGEVVGVVRLSRTAESGLEWLWKNRLPLLGGVALVILAALIVSLLCAALIARPLERLAQAAVRVSVSGSPWPPNVVSHAPRELAVLGDALGAMTTRLAARTAYVAEFAANVSHELKTPLTSIRGAAELLREQWHEMAPAQRDRFLANVQADAERTESLVRGLLHLARIENQAEVPAPAHLRLADVRQGLLARYPEHVEVSLADEAAEVSLPPEHLSSVLGNLVENGLRYRREAPLRVTLRMVAERLEVTVIDDGPGISASNLPKVFERFFTTERDHGGTGLGLAIVRAIAESRGGSARCESSPAGTRFFVRL